MARQTVTQLMAVLVILGVIVSTALASPLSGLQSSALSADKRPKYMETRDLDIFKYMLMASIRELVEEGKMNSAVLNSVEGEDMEGDEETAMPDGLRQVQKRMRYMGICMRRRYNTFIPYPCLRSGRR